jgi:hypothetical protein
MIHDSELTARGFKRKALYNGNKADDPELFKLALSIAEKDISKEQDIQHGYRIRNIHIKLSPEKFKECLPKIEIINI